MCRDEKLVTILTVYYSYEIGLSFNIFFAYKLTFFTPNWNNEISVDFGLSLQNTKSRIRLQAFAMQVPTYSFFPAKSEKVKSSLKKNFSLSRLQGNGTKADKQACIRPNRYAH